MNVYAQQMQHNQAAYNAQMQMNQAAQANQFLNGMRPQNANAASPYSNAYALRWGETSANRQYSNEFAQSGDEIIPDDTALDWDAWNAKVDAVLGKEV